MVNMGSKFRKMMLVFLMAPVLLGIIHMIDINENQSIPPDEPQFSAISKDSNAFRADMKRAFLGLPVVDILSVGNLGQQDLQDAQQETFGSHLAVRNFYRATENDDADSPECQTKLTMKHLEKIVEFCNVSKPQYPVLDKDILPYYWKLKSLKGKKNPTGWMCAQKRPLQGFFNMIRKYNYRNSTINLPDYLWVMDDDTWINMDAVLGYIQDEYPSDTAYAVAGCLLRTNKEKGNLTLPYGGYGLLFTKDALRKWLIPLQCGGSVSSKNNKNKLPKQQKPPKNATFQEHACWRLQQDGIGERNLFRNGMSVADLMYAYNQQSKFINVGKWKGGPGFCLNSDWVWAYFLNYYNIPIQGDLHESYYNPVFDYNTSTSDGVGKKDLVPHDRLLGYNESFYYFGTAVNSTGSELDEYRRECHHSNYFLNNSIPSDAYCGTEAHTCHRITPSHMQYLHSQQQQQQRSTSLMRRRFFP